MDKIYNKERQIKDVSDSELSSDSTITPSVPMNVEELLLSPRSTDGTCKSDRSVSEGEKVDSSNSNERVRPSTSASSCPEKQQCYSTDALTEREKVKDPNSQ